MKSSRIIRIFLPVFLFSVCINAQTTVLQQKADSLFQQESYEQAIPVFQAALADYESQNNPVGAAHCQYHLGISLLYNNQFTAAKSVLRQGLDNIRRNPGRIGADLQVMMQINLSNIYAKEGQFEEAISLSDSTLALALSALPAGDRLVLRSYNAAGMYRLGAHEYLSAMSFFQKGIQLADLDPEKYRTQWRQLKINYAWTCELLRDYDAALRLSHEVEAAGYDSPDKRHYMMSSTAWNTLGRLYGKLGDYNKSLEYYQKSLDFNQRRIQGAQSRNIVNDLGAIGDIYKAREEWIPAIEYYQQALLLRDSMQLNSPTERGLLYSSIAEACVGMGALAKADSMCARALAEDKASKTETAPTLKERIAQYYIKRGQYEAALAPLLEALQIVSNRPQDRFAELSHIQTLIGETEYGLQRYEAALTWFDKALRLQTMPQGGPDSLRLNETVIKALAGKALAKKAGWKPSESLAPLEASFALCQSALRIAERIRRDFQHSIEENFEWSKRVRSIYALGVETALTLYRQTRQQSYLEAAWQLADQNQSRLLHEGLQNTQAKSFSGVPDSLLQREATLSIEIAFFERRAAEVVNDPSKLSKYRDEELFNRRRAREKLILQMEKDYPTYHQLKYGVQNVAPQAVCAALPPRAALLEYFVQEGARKICCFLFTRNKGLQVFESAAAPDLWTDIQELHRLQKSVYLTRETHRKRFIQLSHSLYRHFIQPFAAQLTDIDELMVVNDGPMRYIPLELLLPTPEIRDYEQLDYLFKRFSISYQNSAALFVQDAAKPQTTRDDSAIFEFAPLFEQNNAKYLAASDKRIDEENALRAQDSQNFSRLAYSEEEVCGIARLFTQSNTLLLRDAANEAALKAELQKPHRIIHLATHSFANVEQPKFSGIACAPSGDSGDTEDGILYVSEIYNLNIPADLIVLSSCESGLGKLAGGEGLLGLNRAFAYAGVPNIVYSLWKVNDKAGAELMIEFYKQISEGKTYAAALRAAKLKMLENPATASPNLWGGFLLSGR